MFDTNVTIVGNVLTAPEWRRTAQSGTLVANFKVASTARRLDRESGRWVDGNSLRVRVNCWRKLAEGVASSVMVGDPVVVVGRMYTRDWTDDAGNHRTLYELEAAAVGHDLSRGRSQFVRNRPSMATSSVEDAEAESRVHGEATEPVPDDEVPPVRAGRPFTDDPGYAEAPISPAPRYDDPIATRGGDVDAVPGGGVEAGVGLVLMSDELAVRSDGSVPPDDELAAYPGGADRADAGPFASDLEVDGAEAGAGPDLGSAANDPDGSGAAGARGKRGRGRVPVPA
jgi:single-strand DNA-binding protein